MNLIVQQQLSPTAVKYLKDDFVQTYNNLAIAELADSHFDNPCNHYRQK